MAAIGILDTSMESTNDGDQIIVDAILQNFPLLANAERFPTHRRLRKDELAAAANCETLVLTGTNILRSKIRRDRQWPLGVGEFRAFRGKIILLGVGWRRYESSPNAFNKRLISELITEEIPVAARDAYTNLRLQKIGVASANTGCPTMWNLSEDMLGLGTVDECVFTLTDYNPDPKIDSAILNDLASRYRAVEVWPQSSKDLRYLKRIHIPKNVRIAERGTKSLDRILDGKDYVGTRLHAGIRAAQSGCSVMVIAVDNRALEIGADTGLPVFKRDLGLSSFQDAYQNASANPCTLKIPHEVIDKWKSRMNHILGPSARR